MSNLIKYDQARLALAECRNVDDVKDIRDKSEAMRLYAKQAHDMELEQWAAEIKLRAQRAIGEISAGLDKKASRHATLPAGGKGKTEALANAGISTSTAHRYEQLAAIPNPTVEAYIARSKEAGKPVSAKAVLAETKPKRSAETDAVKTVVAGSTKTDSEVGPVAEYAYKEPSQNTVLAHYDRPSDLTGMDQGMANEADVGANLHGQMHAPKAQIKVIPDATESVQANEAPLALRVPGQGDLVKDELDQLRAQIADLEARLEVVRAEYQMMETILAADDKVKAAMAEAKKQKAKANEENCALYVRVVDLQSQVKKLQACVDAAESSKAAGAVASPN